MALTPEEQKELDALNSQAKPSGNLSPEEQAELAALNKQAGSQSDLSKLIGPAATAGQLVTAFTPMGRAANTLVQGGLGAVRGYTSVPENAPMTDKLVRAASEGGLDALLANIPGGKTVLSKVLGGAAIGTGGSAASQYLQKGSVDPLEAGVSGVIGSSVAGSLAKAAPAVFKATGKAGQVGKMASQNVLEAAESARTKLNETASALQTEKISPRLRTLEKTLEGKSVAIDPSGLPSDLQNKVRAVGEQVLEKRPIPGSGQSYETSTPSKWVPGEMASTPAYSVAGEGLRQTPPQVEIRDKSVFVGHEPQVQDVQNWPEGAPYPVKTEQLPESQRMMFGVSQPEQVLQKGFDPYQTSKQFSGGIEPTTRKEFVGLPASEEVKNPAWTQGQQFPEGAQYPTMTEVPQPPTQVTNPMVYEQVPTGKYSVPASEAYGLEQILGQRGKFKPLAAPNAEVEAAASQAASEARAQKGYLKGLREEVSPESIPMSESASQDITLKNMLEKAANKTDPASVLGSRKGEIVARMADERLGGTSLTDYTKNLQSAESLRPTGELSIKELYKSLQRAGLKTVGATETVADKLYKLGGPQLVDALLQSSEDEKRGK